MKQKPIGFRAGRGRPGAAIVGSLLVAVTLAGCEVTNPGPVRDEFLNLPAAHAALVNGSQRQLVRGLNWTLYNGAHAARELFPSGQTGPGGVGTLEQTGRFAPDRPGVANVWSWLHQSRWIAENALERFTKGDAGTVNPTIFTQAYLWAAFANRALGENMCEAVFNGGMLEPNSRYFERAEKHFTEVIARGTTDQKTAAYGGRAAARVFMKKWAEAVSDAQQVPLNFVYNLDVAFGNEQTENVYWAGTMPAYGIRATSIHYTWFYDYYKDSGDVRVAWRTDPAWPFATGSFSGHPGPVPWSFSLKYKSGGDDIRLTSGVEMVLIRAEALLEQGQWPQAMALINSVHTAVKSDKTGQNLAPLPASSLNEAWGMLKRERSIEFYLEGRRLGDIRRWDQNKTPGVLDWPDFESKSFFMKENPPSKCFPVPDRERDTNPNF